MFMKYVLATLSSHLLMALSYAWHSPVRAKAAPLLDLGFGNAALA